jgi:hypothetical protein
MTRKAPKPLWRSLGRFGDEGPWKVQLPGHRNGEPCDGCLDDRYTATARLRWDRRAILAVSITDRNTGATFQWTARDDRVKVNVASDATAADYDRLHRDGRDIVGLARKQSGGPARGTGVTADELIHAALRLRTDDGWPTEEDLAVEVGRDVRTVRRIGAMIPGHGEPYEKVLEAARRRS